MLHLMRLNGLSTNTVAFKQFAKNMAETFEFDGVAVVGDWEDVDYVQSWVKERAADIQKYLEDVNAHISN